MAIVKEAYSSNRVNLIYQLLKSEAENGSPKEYDIRVDDLKVVSRTTDPERFHSHEEFVLPDTKAIMINIYDGGSNRCTRYNLLLREEDTSKQELSGIEKTINAKMAQAKRNWEYELLKKENEELKAKIKEDEEYQEGMRSKLEELEDEKEKKKQKYYDTLINFAGAYLANKPNALNGIPILGALLGGEDNKQHSSPGSETSETNQDSQCSFSIVEKMPKEFTGEVTVEDNEKLRFALSPFYKPEYIDKVIHILNCLFQYNELIDKNIKVLDHAIGLEEQTKKAA